MNSIKDPENYRRMSEPFASADEANDALSAFYDDVRAARQKHRIADVLVVVRTNVNYEGGEGSAVSRSHNGDPLKAESMAAYAYGAEQAERRQWLNQLVAGKQPGRKE